MGEVMNDVWLPRLYLGAQVLLMLVCGSLIALGKDSIITNLFCAAGGGLIFTSGAQKLNSLRSKTPEK